MYGKGKARVPLDSRISSSKFSMIPCIFSYKKNSTRFFGKGGKWYIDFIFPSPIHDLTASPNDKNQALTLVSSSAQVWKLRWRLCSSYLWQRGDGERKERRRWGEKRGWCLQRQTNQAAPGKVTFGNDLGRGPVQRFSSFLSICLSI